MSTFLLYFPGAESEAQVDLVTLGLDRCLPGSWRYAPCIDGPDKGSGMLACCGSDVTRPRPFMYAADLQSWHKSPDGYWAGIYKGQPPKPSELKQKSLVSGYPIQFADSNEWTIPVIRTMTGGTRLPQTVTVGTMGETIKEVVPKYREICARADEIFAITCEGDINMDDGVMADWVSEALSVNYYGNRFLFGNVLGMFNTENLPEAMLAIVDYPRIQEWYDGLDIEKKNTLSELSQRTDGSLAI